jgi:hypothetical protein
MFFIFNLSKKNSSYNLKQREKSSYCLNCGKVLEPADNYCPNCGQENDNKRQKIGKILAELVQKFLHIDSKIAHSLPALLFKPGYLSTEYLKGKRQKHLDPVKMFITIIILFFLLSHLDKSVTHSYPGGLRYTAKFSEVEDSILKQKPVTFKVGNTGEMHNIGDTLRKTNETVILDIGNYEKVRQQVKAGRKETLSVIDSLHVPNTFWNRMYYSQLIKFAEMDYDDFTEFLSSKYPWIIFSLIPVFALILKLLYFRRKLYYVDHLIFAFHLHSFLFLAGCIHLLVNFFTNYDLDTWFLLLYALYAFLAIKNFYRQSWGKTILKSIMLTFIYAFASLLGYLFMYFIIFLIY